MKFNYGRSMALCSLLFFGAVQANAGDCVLTVTRTACSKETEKESFKKCDGKATCDENKKTGSEAACAKEALKACENLGDRQKITKSKVVVAKYNGGAVEGGKNFCDANRPDFDKCK